jgi:hypothetical protein
MTTDIPVTGYKGTIEIGYDPESKGSSNWCVAMRTSNYEGRAHIAKALHDMSVANGSFWEFRVLSSSFSLDAVTEFIYELCDVVPMLNDEAKTIVSCSLPEEEF